MRHRNKKIILNRPADQRKALKRNLLTSLFESGAVQTTDLKAKLLSMEADRLIILTKKQKESFNAIRELKRVLFTEPSSRKAFEYAQKTKRSSGFTRVTKIRIRPGDGAVVTQVELIQDEK